MQSFDQAQIYGGNFWNIYGDNHQHQTSIQNGNHRVGIQVLSQAISHGAIHNSAERDPPPRCHPGTREKATEDIVRWIEEPNPSSTVLWVSGRAGVGKSALMQRIAELGLMYFGGSFFFRRGAPGCNVKDRLFSTLAYQVAMNIDGMVGLVDWAMVQDYSIPTMSAADQLRRLIIEPIRLLPIPLCPIIIIIDGLDECEDTNSQRDILALIGQVAMDPSVAIRFIIASRPESQICEVFNKEPLFSSTRRLILDEGYDTASDIERYLRENFAEIHLRNRDLMSDVEHPWPREADLQKLVHHASGQFIYAATVIRFVSSDKVFHTPAAKLSFILNPGPMQALAFSELDRLYTQILSLYPDSEVLVRTIGVLLVLETLQSRTFCNFVSHQATIAALAGLEAARLRLVLRALQSITEIQVEPLFDDVLDNQPNGTDIQRMKLSHRSFHDFLADRTRSGPYFIDKALFANQVLCRILELATISINGLMIKRCQSPPLTINLGPDIWGQFDIIFAHFVWWDTNLTPSRIELCCALKNLQATIFNDQVLFSNQLSKPICPALIHILHCLCTALWSTVCWQQQVGLPKGEDPLHLDQFFTNMRNFLDECYRQILSSSIVGPSPILMHLAVAMNPSSLSNMIILADITINPKTLRSIGKICNVQDQHLLKKEVEELSYLIHKQHICVDNKCIVGYYVPYWLRGFFLDSSRSQCFYSTSWILHECQRTMIKGIQRLAAGFSSLIPFFMPPLPLYGSCEFPYDGNCLAKNLLESGSDHNDLLHFLGYLSEIRWFEIYSRGCDQRHLAYALVHWVCQTLESPSLDHNIRGAMYKVFTEILLRGILPALSRQISRSWRFFESQGCLGCLSDIHGRKRLLDVFGFDHLCRTLPMCRDQTFFEKLCTIIIECRLLEIGQKKVHERATAFRHSCSGGHSEELDFFPEITDTVAALVGPSHRRYWSLAFTHASTSSKCILFAIRCLLRLYPFCETPWSAEWIVSEMIEWLKNQTVTPQPQDRLIAWAEDANKKIEDAIANKEQRKLDREQKRSAEWASAMQNFQTMRFT